MNVLKDLNFLPKPFSNQKKPLQITANIYINKSTCKSLSISDIHNESCINKEIKQFIQKNKLKPKAFQFIKQRINKQIQQVKLKDTKSSRIQDQISIHSVKTHKKAANQRNNVEVLKFNLNITNQLDISGKYKQKGSKLNNTLSLSEVNPDQLNNSINLDYFSEDSSQFRELFAANKGMSENQINKDFSQKNIDYHKVDFKIQRNPEKEILLSEEYRQPQKQSLIHQINDSLTQVKKMKKVNAVDLQKEVEKYMFLMKKNKF